MALSWCAFQGIFCWIVLTKSPWTRKRLKTWQSIDYYPDNAFTTRFVIWKRARFPLTHHGRLQCRVRKNLQFHTLKNLHWRALKVHRIQKYPAWSVSAYVIDEDLPATNEYMNLDTKSSPWFSSSTRGWIAFLFISESTSTLFSVQLGCTDHI